ncbi:MAG: hypothetical protein HYY93_13905 [Planctomycetes bacterium]|nr:hypothetical protein [Planctomycetota bacterium]
MTLPDPESTSLVPCLRADLAWLRTQQLSLAGTWEAAAIDGLWPVAATVGHEKPISDLLISTGEVSRVTPDRISIVVPFVRGGRVLLGEDVDAGGGRAWRPLSQSLTDAEPAFRLSNRIDPEAAFEVRRGAAAVSITEVRRRVRGRAVETPLDQFDSIVRRSDGALDDFEHRLRVVLLQRHEREAVERYLHALVGLGRESVRTGLR